MSYWKRNGPPVHIALVSIAASLGVKLLSEESSEPSQTRAAGPGLSIKEIAARITAPVAGGDTLAASKAAAALSGAAVA